MLPKPNQNDKYWKFGIPELIPDLDTDENQLDPSETHSLKEKLSYTTNNG